MSEETTILVLGVGGNVSQGILKALHHSGLRCRTIGACINPLSFGLYTVDRAYLSPLAARPDFVDWLITVCRNEGVRGILSGVEPVLHVLAEHATAIREACGAVCVVAPPPCLAIGNDKLLTCQWLERHGFGFPPYANATDESAVEQLYNQCGFPLIAKPRSGKTSQGLARISGHDQLAAFVGREGYVLEQEIGDSDHEYTAGCFTDRDGRLRGVIVMRRELLEGTTYRAVVGNFPEIRQEAARIALALNPLGPCNVQMRVTPDGRPICFEINVRFSGTTPMRAFLGFNDVAAAIRHYVLNEPAVDLPTVTEGIALRYWNEMYVMPEAARALSDTGKLPHPAEYPAVFENYGLRR